MDDDEFLRQLKELDAAAKSECEDIKQIVSGIVKTYRPYDEK